MKPYLITLAFLLGASGAACAQQPVTPADSLAGSPAAPAPAPPPAAAPTTATPLVPRKPFEEQHLSPAELEARASSRHAQEQQMQELALNPNYHPRRAADRDTKKSGKPRRKK